MNKTINKRPRCHFIYARPTADLPLHLGIDINRAYDWTVQSAKDCNCRVIIVVSRMAMKHS